MLLLAFIGLVMAAYAFTRAPQNNPPELGQ